MSAIRRGALAVVCATALVLVAQAFHLRGALRWTAAASAEAVRPATAASREDAYRANNIGVAHLEQYDFPAAVSAFREALTLDAGLAIARLNLGIALFYGGDAAAARRELEAARAALPDRPQPDYVLGLIARSQEKPDEAIEDFSRVRRLDAADAGAAINAGQLHLQQRKFAEALDAFRAAIAAEPYNATAAYGLATALIRNGNADEGRAAMERFQKLRTTNYAVTYSQAYLEQGRYAEAIASTGAEAELVDQRVPEVGFVDVTAASFQLPASSLQLPAASSQLPASSGSGSPAVALADLDGDGDLDLVDGGGTALRVYKNDRGRFTDATTALFGGAPIPPAIGIVAGDYDNDGRADLLLLRPGGVTLYKQEASGRFVDATAASGVGALHGAPRAAAWLDADHDGDLDLLIAVAAEPGSSTIHLLRNNGDGRFTDITKEAGLSVEKPLLAIVPTDYDDRRDIDMLLAGPAGPHLFRNLRDGTFKDVAGDVGLSVAGEITSVAVGDVNKDGYPDFFFGRRGAAGIVALSDGRARFTTAPAPDVTTGALAAQFVDYDNDGLLDLLVLTSEGPRLLRNVGKGWSDVSSRAFAPALRTAPGGPVALATGDLDGDGGVDAVVRTETGLTILKNEGTRGRSLSVRLTSRVSNRSGLGAKVDMRAGSLRQRLETSAATPAAAPADVIFGLGSRAGADVVRVLWPSGILQAETSTAKPPAPLSGALKVEELDRKPSSCPFLYTWNGSRFEFITDFLGGGEMGYLEAPGERNQPDPDEYVRIEGDRLKPRNGRYELRITNELEEALFLDRTELIAVAHPRGTDVYPNGGLRSQPDAFHLFVANNARPPLAAIDEHGHDVLDRITAIDRRYPDDFALERIRGYAAEHTLTLTLPAPPKLLLLTGWTDYAYSGDNLAASQMGLKMIPPALQVADAHGVWHTAIPDIGFPVGRPQTVVVDLAGKIPADATRVRIVTTMRIYWDRILVADQRTPRTPRQSDPRTPRQQDPRTLRTPRQQDPRTPWQQDPRTPRTPWQQDPRTLRTPWQQDPRTPRTPWQQDPRTLRLSEQRIPRPDDPRLTRLEPAAALLRWRGFSTEVSPDGREPYGYDYDRVTPFSPWKLLPGRYTREGDVRELLLRSDDRFVIARPGDEIALSFDAARLPPLPDGWTRTFLLYGDGFSKEMDLNSASPDELAPLPFHGMGRYPYDPADAPPLTPQQRMDLDRYQTRIVKRTLPPIELQRDSGPSDQRSGTQRKLVWSDEFDTPGLPDASKWSYDEGGSGWGNNELQFYTRGRLENARVENGRLIIEARREPWKNRQYTSARLVTKGHGDWTYGRIEVRAKLPRGRGSWPAIWMLPTMKGPMKWPDDGEIDIMEHVGYDPGVIHGSAHTKSYNHVIGTQKTATTPVPDAMDQFHVYAIEWTPSAIRWLVDDHEYFSFQKEEGGKDVWPFDAKFHLILNIAVGGNWGGKEGTDEAALPFRMEVDYVRVYR